MKAVALGCVLGLARVSNGFAEAIDRGGCISVDHTVVERAVAQMAEAQRSGSEDYEKLFAQFLVRAMNREFVDRPVATHHRQLQQTSYGNYAPNTVSEEYAAPSVAPYYQHQRYQSSAYEAPIGGRASTPAYASSAPAPSLGTYSNAPYTTQYYSHPVPYSGVATAAAPQQYQPQYSAAAPAQSPTPMYQSGPEQQNSAPYQSGPQQQNSAPYQSGPQQQNSAPYQSGPEQHTSGASASAPQHPPPADAIISNLAFVDAKRLIEELVKQLNQRNPSCRIVVEQEGEIPAAH